MIEKYSYYVDTKYTGPLSMLRVPILLFGLYSIARILPFWWLVSRGRWYSFFTGYLLLALKDLWSPFAFMHVSLSTFLLRLVVTIIRSWSCILLPFWEEPVFPSGSM